MRIVDRSEILSLVELGGILADLRRRAGRTRNGQPESLNTRENLIIVYLATCYGLRAGEIAAMELRHVILADGAAYLSVPTEKKRGGKRPLRPVPLDLCPAGREDVASWKALRIAQGARPSDPLVCTLSKPRAISLRGRKRVAVQSRKRIWFRTQMAAVDDVQAVPTFLGQTRAVGDPLNRQAIRNRFMTAMRPLGRPVTTHTGRHTFASHCLAVGYPPQQVAAWLGHSSLQITAIYAHAVSALTDAPKPVFTLTIPETPAAGNAG